MDLINELKQEANDNNNRIRICKHVCEKKKRQCKFNAIRNCDYCVEHLAFNQQVF